MSTKGDVPRSGAQEPRILLSLSFYQERSLAGRSPLPTSEKPKETSEEEEDKAQTYTEEDWEKWHSSSSTSWSWSNWRWHE